MQSLYDRIFQAVTYTPDSKIGAFDPSRTLLQLSKNEAIDPADFKNQLTPMNPNGDYNAAQQFSAMVDIVPAIQPDYAPTTRQVSNTYKEIVFGAVTDAKPNPAQQKTYQENADYLNTNTSIPNPGDQPPTISPGPSAIALTYQNNQAAYTTAVSGYRVAQNGYDLTITKDQRDWNAVAPMLQLNIDKSWNAWNQQGKANVERAQNAMASTVNDIVSSIIADSQKAVAPERWNAGGPAGSNPWLLAYPLPGDWAAASGSSGATQFSLKSSYLHTEADSKFSSYGGGASWGAGLWSVGGSFNHSEGQTSDHMDANTIEINAKMTIVRVMRPWLNSLLFDTKGWWLKSQLASGISNGTLIGNTGMLPLVPTAFIVMSDVTIKGDFSAKDQSHIESATSGSTSVGWGPFSIGGSYSHSESHDKLTATYDAGTIRIPGMQIVAWVSEIIPACAPMPDPASTKS